MLGVLCLQGAFIEHIRMFRSLGAETVEIRQKKDLFENALDGVVIPGGESTVMGKLLKELGMEAELRRRIREGMPVFGTCAGLILLAERVANDDRTYLSTMDITVRRNAYGRQLGSFAAVSSFAGVGEVPMTFIRAPFIEEAGKAVEVLSVVDGKIVAARQGNQLVTAFHPELTGDPRIHSYFLEMMKGQANL